MNRDGFTLVELIAVILICVALIALATMSFKGSSDKSTIESQFRTMYADLMGVRSQALYRKKPRSVTFTTTGYSVYSSNNVGVTPLKQTALKVAVTTVPSNLQINFDQMGFATFNNSTTSTAYVCAQTMAAKAVYNSIILAQTRIQMGSLSGSGCNSAKPQ